MASSQSLQSNNQNKICRKGRCWRAAGNNQSSQDHLFFLLSNDCNKHESRDKIQFFVRISFENLVNFPSIEFWFLQTSNFS
jgi:hypothetical protein